MTSEQLVQLLAAITALVVAAGVLVQRIESLGGKVDGVLHELLVARVAAAKKEGELEGRDYVRRQLQPPPEEPPS